MAALAYASRILPPHQTHPVPEVSAKLLVVTAAAATGAMVAGASKAGFGHLRCVVGETRGF